MSRPWLIILCWSLMMTLAGTGCVNPFHRAKPQASAPPLPPPPKPAPVEPPKIETAGPPPDIEAKQPAPELPKAIGVVPKTPAPKPARRHQPKPPAQQASPAGQSAQSGTTPPGADTAGGPSPAPPIRLGEILSEGQRQQLLTACDASLARTRDALSRVRGLSLSPAQRETLARVRSFMDQASRARDKDPQTARQLAERADLLSQDLLRSLR